MPTSDWVYVAPATVESEAPRLTTPNGILEAGILEEDGEINWAYEVVSNTIIVSNRRLEMTKKPKGEREYRHVGTRKVTKSGDRIRVPCPLQPGPSRGDMEILKETIPDSAFVYPDERYHFVYRGDMADGETRSCYLLTDEEVQRRLSGPEDWGGNFEPTPQFF